LTEHYYKILRVSPSASIAEIKKAYKKRAKELHPDINKSADAHEQFVLLNEAYEYLSQARPSATSSRPAGPGTTNSRSYSRQREQWMQAEREAARARAAQHAAMEYEKFRQTKFYRNMNTAEDILDYVQLGFFVIIVVVVPIAATMAYGSQGIIMSVIIIIVTVSWWAGVLRTFVDKAKKRK
jgi:hypothetical protein